jgi:hypothetical protein
MVEEQQRMSEIERIDRCWREKVPMILGETSCGMAAAFGMIPVVSPLDYDQWWELRGKEAGAPKRSEIVPTSEPYRVRWNPEGHIYLSPKGETE